LLKKLFRHLFLILGCLHLVGGPYSIIQVYAWVNMLASYSQQSSVSQALVDTFSGQKPCHLCAKITAAKSTAPAEQAPESPLLSSASKLFETLFPPAELTLKQPLSSPFPQPSFLAVREIASAPSSGPPVPPPRC
jgi:hypothetical protein